MFPRKIHTNSINEPAKRFAHVFFSAGFLLLLDARDMLLESTIQRMTKDDNDKRGKKLTLFGNKSERKSF